MGSRWALTSHNTSGRSRPAGPRPHPRGWSRSGRTCRERRHEQDASRGMRLSALGQDARHQAPSVDGVQLRALGGKSQPGGSASYQLPSVAAAGWECQDDPRRARVLCVYVCVLRATSSIVRMIVCWRRCRCVPLQWCHRGQPRPHRAFRALARNCSSPAPITNVSYLYFVRTGGRLRDGVHRARCPAPHDESTDIQRRHSAWPG